MAFVSAKEQIAIGGYGTAIGGTITPANLHQVAVDGGSFSATENIDQILDQGRSGSELMDYRSFAGIKSTELSFDFPMMYGNATGTAGNAGGTFGILLRNILGAGTAANNATDSLRQTQVGSTSTYTNYFRLGGSKEYIAVGRKLFATGTSDAIYGGARVTELTLSGNAGEGFVTCSTTLMGKSHAYSDLSGVTFKTDSISNDIAQGWQNSEVSTYPQKIVGTTVTNIISFEVTLSREATPLYTTGNSQDYSDIYLGPLEVTFNIVADIPTQPTSGGSTLINQFRENTQGVTQLAVSHTSATGSGSASGERTRFLVLGMVNSTLLESPIEIDTSGTYATVSVSGRALANINPTTGAIVNPQPSAQAYSTNNMNLTPIEVALREVGNTTTAPTYL